MTCTVILCMSCRRKGYLSFIQLSYQFLSHEHLSHGLHTVNSQSTLVLKTVLDRSVIALIGLCVSSLFCYLGPTSNYLDKG